MNTTWRSLGLALAAALLGGCHSLKVTEPQRSVTEQLLLSQAADQAVKSADFASLRGRKIFVEAQYFKSYDEGHALGAIRQHLSEAGARLMSQASDADVIVEVRSAGLGLDTRDSLLGIPALNLPIPLAGAVSTPEIALYKSSLADSAGKFALFAYDRKSGEHLHSSGAFSGTAYFHHYRFLGLINWRSTDVPELDPKLRRKVRDDKKP
jgi:hypothetical protein